jgi:hypothetical protein
MVKDDFKIDFKNKKIFYNPEGSGEVYTVNELYSWLQHFFAKRDNMPYQIPILAMTKTEYFLVNGWTIDEKARKYLKEGILVVSHVITEP